jgi:hypothetical protein
MDMSVATDHGTRTASPAAAAGFSYIEWGPVIAGAIGAAAISFVLLTFGSAIGLTATSSWPGRGMSLMTVMILAAIWTALVQVGSFAAGGYIAGRMRSRWADGPPGERRFRDGAHGFVVWALAVLVGAWVGSTAVAEALKTGVSAGATAAAGTSGKNENDRLMGPSNPADYAVDYLFRPPPNAPAAGGPAGTAVTSNEARAELTRVFVAGLRDGSLPARDRTYLAQAVSARTGISHADAERRVDEAFTEAKNAEGKAREAADKARKAAAVGAFLTAATLAAACAAACAGAALGGRHRDDEREVRFFGAARFW